METSLPVEGVTVIGCGAQAKYVMEIFARTGRVVSQVLDPIGGKVGKRMGGISIDAFSIEDFLRIRQYSHVKARVIVGLADNRQKSHIFNALHEKTEYVNAIHPVSTIAATAKLGAGVIVNAGAVIQPHATVGNGCMIHAGVIIEHDCVIEDFVNIGPGATLAGGVRVSEGATVFSGAVVVPNVQIGKYAVIGAGSLVLHNVPDGVLAYGNPAKIIRELD
jgi:acetyltransferase EpsM